MDFFSMLPFGRPRKRKTKKTPQTPEQQYANRRPKFESLEDRSLPSATTISGFVYEDLNVNGIKDAGEQGIANNEIELRNAAGQVIATTTTDANGFYEFDRDETLNTAPQTLEQTVTIPDTLAGFSITKAIDQFDPTLGELISVEIINEGSITSDIRAENSSTLAGGTITGNVSGSLTLSGPGFSLNSTVSQNAGSFVATAYDGTIDFDGTSGRSFTPVTANAAPQSIVLTGAQLQAYIGTGTVDVTEQVEVNSSATGGGNLLVGITSLADATITVRYTYQPTDCLQPGEYTVVQREQPPLPGGTGRYYDGSESRNTVVIPNSKGTDSIPVTLGSTNDSTNNNFGELPPSELSGFVYFDANNNGVKENDTINSLPREPGIGGVNVTLSGVDDLGQSVSLNTTTAADGSYSFTNLRPGTYSLSETQPAAYQDGKDSIGSQGGVASNDLFSDINLGAGVSGTDNNFGEVNGGSISGFVYHDVDDDGIKDPGEAGIGGVEVTLTGTDDQGAVTRTTTTAADGSYMFNDLRIGTYTIQEAQPSDFLDGKDTAGSLGGIVSNDRIEDINLGANQNSTNNNFGELTNAGLRGFVYEDLDNDGIKDAGEAGIAGVEVTLTGIDDNGSVTRTTTTAADGSYRFADLRPGTYTIQEAQPSGYLDGKDTIGTQGGVTSNDEFSNITLAAGQLGFNNNFGELPNASLSGFVYNDVDNDGIKDGGEAGIGGVQVTLTGFDDQGSVSRTTTTNFDGSYSFENLRPGTYTIQETHPLNYLDGKDTIGSQGGSTSNDRFSNATLAAGQNGQNNNFGELEGSSLSGYVYHDEFNDGIRDPGEAGIAGTQVTLSGTTDQGTVNRSVTTNADGYYEFTDLRPGSYTIRESQPTGFLDGKDTAGTQGGTVTNDRITNINLGQNIHGQENNFGEIRASSLAGYVYEDSNDNGVKDPGENGISGTSVTLTGVDDLGASVNRVTTTSFDGSYRFNNLRPGDYVLQETQPGGFLDGQDSIGSQGGTVSNDRFDNIALGENVNGVDNNFGEIRTSGLSGNVYHDANGNGVRDFGEAGIAGVAIRLTGTSPSGTQVWNTTTDGSGHYSFNNLPPGTYTIEETQPAGYLDGQETLGSLGGTVSNDRFGNVTLANGATGVNYDFGEELPASLSGSVYHDVNDNGFRDGGESGIGGTLVTLTGTTQNGQPVSQQTTTSADGTYRFDNLRPGVYTIEETQPSGYLDGKDRLGTQGGVLTNDLASNIVLGSNANGTNYDFGERVGTSLSGYVYEDLNDDGIKDGNEAGIGGVQVNLTGTNDQGTVNRTTTTAADGSYSFDNLLPGTYSVLETQPANYLDGKDTAGTSGGTAGNDNISNISIQQGVPATQYNFGELRDGDVGIDKEVSSDRVLAGGTVTFTVTVTNNGPFDAENVQVIDTLPPGLTVSSVNAPGWTATSTGSLITFTKNTNLASGASSTFTFEAVTDVDIAPGTFINTAEVTVSTVDNNPDNNIDTVPFTVPPTDISPEPPGSMTHVCIVGTPENLAWLFGG